MGSLFQDDDDLRIKHIEGDNARSCLRSLVNMAIPYLAEEISDEIREELREAFQNEHITDADMNDFRDQSLRLAAVGLIESWFAIFSNTFYGGVVDLLYLGNDMLPDARLFYRDKFETFIAHPLLNVARISNVLKKIRQTLPEYKSLPDEMINLLLLKGFEFTETGDGSA